MLDLAILVVYFYGYKFGYVCANFAQCQAILENFEYNATVKPKFVSESPSFVRSFSPREKAIYIQHSLNSTHLTHLTVPIPPSSIS